MYLVTSNTDTHFCLYQIYNFQIGEFVINNYFIYCTFFYLIGDEDNEICS